MDIIDIYTVNYSASAGRKYARTVIVAAQMGQEILAPCSYDGTMNHELFEDWFENHLLQELPKDTVIVMKHMVTTSLKSGYM